MLMIQSFNKIVSLFQLIFKKNDLLGGKFSVSEFLWSADKKKQQKALYQAGADGIYEYIEALKVDGTNAAEAFEKAMAGVDSRIKGQANIIRDDTAALSSYANKLSGAARGLEATGTSMDKLSLKAKAANFAVNALNTIAGAATGMLVGTALSWTANAIISGFDAAIVTTEELAEAAEEAQSSIATLTEDYKTLHDTVLGIADAGGIAQEFAKLAQGVDRAGQNVSLTSDQYERYLELSNQLAKAANKPTYNASEIEGLSDFISGEINDTNTTYKIEQDGSDAHKLILYSKEAGSQTWNPVSTITTADTIYDDTELNNEIDALKDLIGETGVAAQIAAALGALDKSDAAVGGQFVTSVSQTDGVVSVTRAALQASDIPALGVDKITGLQTALDSKASANALSAIDGKVTTLIGDDTAKSVRTIANEELAAQLIPEGAAESLNTLQEIAAWIQEHPDDASAMNSAITALQAQLTGIGSGSGTVKAYVDAAISALNIGDYVTASALAAAIGNLDVDDAAVEGQVVSAVSEVDGKIQVSRRALVAADIPTLAVDKISGLQTALDSKVNSDALADVATSGKMEDLSQDTYIVLNCGSSSVNV